MPTRLLLPASNEHSPAQWLRAWTNDTAGSVESQSWMGGEMLVKVLVASLIAVFGLMYWQAPAGQTLSGSVTAEPANEWQKLRQQIQSHQQHFANPAPFRRQDAYRNVERASIPQLTETYTESAQTPVQEEVAEAAPGERTAPFPVAATSSPRRLTSRRTASTATQPHPKRIVRITTYEDGRAVGVRTFEVNGAARGGSAHRRYYLACPGGKCQPLTASMFGTDGRFN